MSALGQMLAGLDDEALAGLASPGVLRRAKGALGKPDAAETLEREDNSARLRIEAQQVTIAQDGPAKAQCDCPATGICRHVLMAVLHLRATAPAPTSGQAPGAREEIEALSLEEIRAFAGADWPHAIRIARISRSATPEPGESSCVLHLNEAPGPVTFLTGGGLRKALFKGPEGRRKRFVAAAALVIAGLRPDPEEDSTDRIDPELLKTARAAVIRALTHGLKGDPLLAQDALFDIAISARADAAPRLAALLRAAARKAAGLAARDPDADPVDFLAELAECHALIRALQTAPDDLLLAGQLRRNFQIGAAMDLAVLGVAMWRNPSGARGLTIHGWDGQRFVSSGPARAAGQDPGFSPRQAYRQPWWRGLSANRMAGHWLHLPEPRLSPDGVLGGQLEARRAQAALRLEDLPLHEHWPDLRADLASRQGIGLRATGRALPALIRLTTIAPPRFDEIEQMDLLDVADGTGHSLTLTIPQDGCAQRLHERQHHGLCALIEAVPKDEEMQYRLLSVLVGDPVEIWNVTLDTAPASLSRSTALDKMRIKARRFMTKPPQPPVPSAVTRFAEFALQALCDRVQSPVSDNRLKSLTNQAHALGLARVAAQMDPFDPQDNEAALCLCWTILLIRRAAARNL